MRRMTERGGEGVQFVDFCVAKCLDCVFSSSLSLSSSLSRLSVVDFSQILFVWRVRLVSACQSQ